MNLLTTTISLLLGLTLVAAKTDIGPPCTSSTTYVGGIFTRIFYIPDTGELCELIDCGGGRAPPKTTVPGCPLYSGTEPVPTHYLPGWGPGGRLIETTTTTSTSGGAAAEATDGTSMLTATAGGSVYASASASTDAAASTSSSVTTTGIAAAATAQITGSTASDSARDSASVVLASSSGATGSAAAAVNATTPGVVRGNEAAAGFRVRSAGVAAVVVGAVALVGGVML
ncbi:hypothetical protein BO82DRAFT_351082 [Aspergillus uvarum CBS 121591]|uniref:Siderophore biosynthesis enzyme n=1 Tax=Aspergillus uvarum CBS 121591 TaxID=1448315 RepID=A0A319E3V6_9EURO|nr:hypothetical protein BO82DRAFT_351082 [Aspergillus uvarum CBS 121591]PYH85762.1 hypothetical protein BO82DRAFT_351082 [Aspergillus uvarum CBS 121591]